MRPATKSGTSSSDRLTTVLFYAVLFLLAYLVYRIFEPFLVPLGWAGVLVVFFYPLHERLEKRLGKTRAAALSTAGVTLILILPALFLVSLFVREALEATRAIERGLVEGQAPSLARAWEWITKHAPAGAFSGGAADLSTLVKQAAGRAAEFLATRLGAVLRNVASFVFDLFVMLFALFFFFRDGGGIVDAVRRLLPFEEVHRDTMISEARNMIFASVTTSLILAAVHGIAGGISFAVVGIPTPLFWGVCMAFVSLIPAVGSGLIWAPAAIWLAVNGHPGRALVLAGICAGVAGTVDSFLRPMLLGGRTRLNALLVFISVIGGVGVFGMLGLVLGPIVVATTAGVLDVYFRSAETHPMAAV